MSIRLLLVGLAALALSVPAEAQKGPGKLKPRATPKASKSSSSSSSSSTRRIVVKNGKVVVDEATENGRKVTPSDDLARIVSSGSPEDCERFVREWMRRQGFPDAKVVVAKDSSESSSSSSDRAGGDKKSDRKSPRPSKTPKKK